MSYESEEYLKLVDSLVDQFEKVSPKQLKKMLDTKKKLHLIDVRENDEWAEARIKEATHVSRGILEREIGSIVHDPGAAIILYSEEGGRAVLSAYFLQKMGYKNVKTLKGGFRSWLEAGLPIEEPQSL